MKIVHYKLQYLSHNTVISEFITRFHKNDMKLQNCLKTKNFYRVVFSGKGRS